MAENHKNFSVKSQIFPQALNTDVESFKANAQKIAVDTLQKSSDKSNEFIQQVEAMESKEVHDFLGERLVEGTIAFQTFIILIGVPVSWRMAALPPNKMK